MKTIQKIFDISSIQRITFRQDINGLRALSVLAVVFYHADFETFKGGWLGVDIFFVISGYLISNIIISELNEGNFSFQNFYLKRVKRILPALASTLLITIPPAYFLLTPKSMIEFSKSAISSIFFYANYHFQNLDFYNSEPSKYMPLLHSWSLSIEEQYYLIFPVIAVLLFKYFKKSFAFLIIFISVISIYLNVAVVGVEKFYQLQFRAWELLLGVLIMIISSKIKVKNIETMGILLILFSLIYFDDSWIDQLEPKLISLSGASMVILSKDSSNFINRILGSGIFRIIGISSYSIYLLHQPIFSFLRIYQRGRLSGFTISLKLTALVVTLFLGYISYIFIEKRMPENKNFFKILIFVYSVSLIFFSSAILNEGLNSRFSSNLQRLDSYYSYTEQRSNIDTSKCNKNKEFENLLHFCNINYKEGNKNLIFLGDSHIKTTAKYTLDNLDKDKYNFFFLTSQGCPFILPLKNNESRANCGDEQKVSELEFILRKDNSYLVYGGRFPWYYNGKAFETNLGTIGDDTSNGEELIIDGLEKNITFLSAKVEKLILIYPIPELGYYPLEPYLYGYYEFEEEILYDISYWNEYSKEVNNYFESLKSDNISKIFPEDYFCNLYFENMCTSSFNGKFFYYDDDHLTLDGAKFIGSEILSILN